MPGDSNKEQQNATNLPSTDVAPSYDELEPHYQYALEARLDGAKYRVIVQALIVKGFSTTEQTVRRWFAKGGPLNLIYRQMKRERAREVREMFKHLREEYEDIAPEAMLTIKANVRKGNLAAALHVMEVNGFEPVHKIEDVTPRKVNILIVKPEDVAQSREIANE